MTKYLKFISVLNVVCGLLISGNALAQDQTSNGLAPVEMFVSIPLKEDAFADFLSVLQNNVRESRKEDGNISFDAYQREEGGAELFLIERWRNQEILDAHWQTPHLKAVEAALENAERTGEELEIVTLVALSPAAPQKPVSSPQTTRNVIVTLYIKPEATNTFTKVLLDTVEPSRAAPGNIAFDVYQDEADKNTLVIVERWESVAAHEAHLEQPYNKPLNDIFESSLARPLGEGRRLLKDVSQ